MIDQVQYGPGESFLAVGARVVLLSSDADLVRRMWPVIRDGGDTVTVLADVLSGGFGSLADLVLVESVAERVEILVRGDVDIVVESASSRSQQVHGRGVRTWRECSVEDATAITVAGAGAGAGAGGVAGIEPDDGNLPLRSGVARAAGFRWSAAADGAPHTCHEPAASALPTAMPPPPVPPARVMPAPMAPAPAARQIPDATPVLGPPVPAPHSVPPPPPVPAPPPEWQAQEVPPPPPRPLTGAAQPAAVSAPGQSPADTRLGAGDEFEHLFESTILRTPEDAAVRLDPEDDQDGPEPGLPSSLSPRLGDHDGSTILGGQLAALLRAGQELAAKTPPPPPSPPPARPATARLELVFSTGQVVPLDQPVVVGRKPQVDRVSGSQIPRLVTVTGPNNDISRSHLEIRPDGGDLLVTDLGSTNGTVLVDLVGTRTLTAHVAQAAGAGARMDLGDGVTIDVRSAR